MSDTGNFGPWIDWAGGECPIPDAKAGDFEIRHHAGDEEISYHPAIWWSEGGADWWKNGKIIAYRVRLPADDLLRQAIEALWEYMTSVDLMNAAMRDGLNVHGALSQFTAAEDKARAVLAAAAERGL